MARITVQKGIFVCPGDVTLSFEDNLCAFQGYENEDNVIKYIIKMEHKKRMEALRDLYDFNITRANLFPGLDGFAASLSITTPQTLLQ